MTETIADVEVDRLASVAAQLVARVRDEDPDAVGLWLAQQLPSPDQWWQLAFVLAAAVPLDRPFSHLTAWARMATVETSELFEHRQAVLCGDLIEPLAVAA
jgi:hypothetical protein